MSTAQRAEPLPQEYELAARIGRFALLRQLGEGGMGTVLLGYDEQLDRKVAIKVLRSRYQGATARRRTSARASLDHDTPW